MSDIETPNWLTDEPCWLRDEPAPHDNNSSSDDDNILGCLDDDDDIIDWLCTDGATDMKVAKASAMAERSKLDDVRQQLNVMNPAAAASTEDLGDDNYILDHDGFRFRRQSADHQCTAGDFDDDNYIDIVDHDGFRFRRQSADQQCTAGDFVDDNYIVDHDGFRFRRQSADQQCTAGDFGEDNYVVDHDGYRFRRQSSDQQCTAGDFGDDNYIVDHDGFRFRRQSADQQCTAGDFGEDNYVVDHDGYRFRRQSSDQQCTAGDFGDDNYIVDHDGFRFRQSDHDGCRFRRQSDRQYCTTPSVVLDQRSSSNDMETLSGSSDALQRSPPSLRETTEAEAKCNQIRSAEDRCSSDNMMAATDHETFKDCLEHDLQDLTPFESSFNHVGLCGGTGTVSMIRSHSGTSNESGIGTPQSAPASSDQAVALLGTGGIFPNSALISTASISSSFAAALIPSASGELFSNNYHNAVMSLPLRYLHGTHPHNERGGTVPLLCTGGNPAPAPLGSVLQELMWSSGSCSNIASFSSSLPLELMKPPAAAGPHGTGTMQKDGAMHKDHGTGAGQPTLLRGGLVPRVIEGGAVNADGVPPSSVSKSVDGVHDLSSLHWKSPAAKTRAARKRRMAKTRVLPAAIRQPAAAPAKGRPSISPEKGKASGTKKMLQGKDSGRECRRSKVGGGTKVPPPPPAPLDLPHEKISGLDSVNAQPRFLLQKELKPSDVGTLGRIVLPKRDAEAHLPDLTAREGINLVMEDLVNSKVWNLRFRFWPNNKSRMYLLENTRDFVKTHNLEEGDFLMIYKDDQSGKYLIRAKKVARLDHASNNCNASSGRKLQRSSSQGANLGNSCHITQDMVAPKLEHESVPCLDTDAKIEINDMHIEKMFEL